MPTYDYICKSCQHQFTRILKIDDRKAPEEEPCPSCNALSVSQTFTTAPAIGDPIRIGVTKKRSDFNEVLKGIHSKTAGSKLDTYL